MKGPSPEFAWRGRGKLEIHVRVGRSRSLDLNPEPPEYEAWGLTTWPRHSVTPVEYTYFLNVFFLISRTPLVLMFANADPNLFMASHATYITFIMPQLMIFL
jgi:hypothetical protein